jgi:hypothetical protein
VNNEVDEMHREMMRAGRAVFSTLLSLGEQFARSLAERARNQAAQAALETERTKAWLYDLRCWVAAQAQGTPEVAAQWDKHMESKWDIDMAQARAEAARVEELSSDNPAGVHERACDLFGSEFVDQVADDLGVKRPDRTPRAERGVWTGGSESVRLSGMAFTSVMGTYGEEMGERPTAPQPNRLQAATHRFTRSQVSRVGDRANDLGM